MRARRDGLNFQTKPATNPQKPTHPSVLGYPTLTQAVRIATRPVSGPGMSIVATGGSMKDRIGNRINVGDRVLVHLPDPTVIGFVSEARETSVVAQVRGNGVQAAPGRLLVTFVLALPVDTDLDMVGQVVKVHDPAADAAAAAQETLPPLNAASGSSRTN